MEKYVLGILKVKADKVEETKEAAKIAAERVRENEPNTRWEIRQSQDDPTTFFHIGSFPDQAAVDFHASADHTQENAKLFDEVLDGEAEFAFCNLIARA